MLLNGYINNIQVLPSLYPVYKYKYRNGTWRILFYKRRYFGLSRQDVIDANGETKKKKKGLVILYH